MSDGRPTQQVQTLVIGGGQAGLAVGYHLGRLAMPYTIVDANEQVGDAWRNRWDSLRLFTPNWFNGLPGKRFPGFHWAFPSKDQMADYLAAYADEFDIDVQTGVRVQRLHRDDGLFVADADDRRFVADNVVVAMSSWQRPRRPDFADQLDADVVQLHSADYRNPGQLHDGLTLVVGAGNSGAEIALELARTRDVWLSGPSTGVIPFRPESAPARIAMRVVGRIVFHRILTTNTPVGRRARPRLKFSGEPLVRVKPRDLAEFGVKRVPRVTGVHQGQPELEDGRRLEVANVVWATGFQPGFTWIDLSVIDPATGEPNHDRGIVNDVPGLYFVGLKFLHAVSSEQIHGVGRDAAHVVEAIAARQDSTDHSQPNRRQSQVESI